MESRGILGQFPRLWPPFRGDAALDTGAKANLAFSQWIRNHNSLSGRRERPPAAPYSAFVRSKFGNGWVAAEHHAADASVAIGGKTGLVSTFSVEAEILVLSIGAALEALDGKVDFSRNCLNLVKLEAP